MTKIELNGFRKVLRAKQDELKANGITGREALAIEASADELDRIQHVQERDLSIGGLDRNAKLLREVRAALVRIERGTYGTCVECEEDISMKRLAAVPWTASCIACQESADTMAGQPWGGAGEELLANAD